MTRTYARKTRTQIASAICVSNRPIAKIKLLLATANLRQRGALTGTR